MLIVIVIIVALVVIVVRELMRPVPTEPVKTKRIETYSRVPWVPKHIDVPDRRK